MHHRIFHVLMKLWPYLLSSFITATMTITGSPFVSSPKLVNVSSEVLKSSSTHTPTSPQNRSSCERDSDDRLQPIQNVNELQQNFIVSVGQKKRINVQAVDVNWTGEHIAMALQDGRACIVSVSTETKPIYVRITKMVSAKSKNWKW